MTISDTFGGPKRGHGVQIKKKKLISRPNVSLLIVLDEKTGHFQNLIQKVFFLDVDYGPKITDGRKKTWNTSFEISNLGLSIEFKWVKLRNGRPLSFRKYPRFRF